MGIQNLISVAGLLALVGLAWLLSNRRDLFSTRVVLWGLGLQFLFGIFVFIVPFGAKLFGWLNALVFDLLLYANKGSLFVFGALSIGPGKPGSMGMFLAFQILPSVIFFSAIVGLLYYTRIMQRVVGVFSALFTRLMGISGAESLCVSSNIFVGVESGLTIRPYLNGMTRSELFTILTSGMATIASTVLGVYAGFLEKTFPSIAGHLISASLLTAPAVLVVSKLMFPETEEPETAGTAVKGEFSPAGNWVEAIIESSMQGVRLAVGIGAMLLAFVSFVALLNALLGWLGGALFSMPDLSIQGILAYVFYPFVRLLGVPAHDANLISNLLGQRVVLTEFPTYAALSKMIATGALQDPRSVVIATYCLCGFAHIPSVAIFVGGFAAIEKRRARDLGALGFRALIAATIACMMTGAIAGIFYVPGKDTILLKKTQNRLAPRARQGDRKAAAPGKKAAAPRKQGTSKDKATGKKTPPKANAPAGKQAPKDRPADARDKAKRDEQPQPQRRGTSGSKPPPARAVKPAPPTIRATARATAPPNRRAPTSKKVAPAARRLQKAAARKAAASSPATR